VFARARGGDCSDIEAEIFWKMDLYRREEQQELQHEMADTDLRARP
jgi:hypothetical protein